MVEGIQDRRIARQRTHDSESLVERPDQEVDAVDEEVNRAFHNADDHVPDTFEHRCDTAPRLVPVGRENAGDELHQSGQDLLDALHQGRRARLDKGEKRIDEAKRLLLGEEIPLAAIAEQLGFRDYNYFSRAFKKRCGYTPSAYRRLWLK